MTNEPKTTAESLPLAVTSAPERIFLDLGFNPREEDAHFSSLHDLTWSADNATGDGIEYVRADLAASPTAQAAPAAVAVPIGWKLVPAELTEGMRREAFPAASGKLGAQAAYRAMLASAPQPPAEAQEPVAYLHDDPDRYDVIHAAVKKLLHDSHDAAGRLHRPVDKSARYTIPLYDHPAPQQAVPLETTRFNPADGSPETALQMAAVIALHDEGEAVPTSEQAGAPPGFALVPLRLTRAMDEVLQDEGWQWEDLLAAANAITESDHQAISRAEPTDDEIRESFKAYGAACTDKHLEAVREVIGNLPAAPASGGAAPVAEGDNEEDPSIGWEPLTEDAEERARFDQSLDIYMNDPRAAIATALEIWAKTHKGGSYGAMCAIFANEVMKLHRAAHALGNSHGKGISNG